MFTPCQMLLVGELLVDLLKQLLSLRSEAGFDVRKTQWLQCLTRVAGLVLQQLRLGKIEQIILIAGFQLDGPQKLLFCEHKIISGPFRTSRAVRGRDQSLASRQLPF